MRLLNLLATVLVYLVVATGLGQVRGGCGPWRGTAHVLQRYMGRGQQSWQLDGSWVQGDFLLLCVTPAAFGLQQAQPNRNATAFPQLLEVLFCTLITDTLCVSQLLRIQRQYLINYHRLLFTLTFMTLGGLHP